MTPISKILVVDDNENNRYSFVQLLKASDREIVTANSGKDALEKLFRDSFTLILLDVQMPEMDGLELASLIRSKNTLRDIPIIFISAHYQSDEFVKRGLALGAFDYIVKPVDPFILRSKIDLFLKLIQKQQEAQETTRVLLKEIAELKASQIKVPAKKAAKLKNSSEWKPN